MPGIRLAIFACTNFNTDQEAMDEVKAMRIIVGYNGSDASKAAVTDLHNSGFGDTTEVLVLTVAEEWSYPRTLDEAQLIADAAKEEIERVFPAWTVAAEVASGSPPRELLARAASFHPDLIVVGEPRHDLANITYLSVTPRTSCLPNQIVLSA